MSEISVRLAHSPDSDDMVMWWPLVGLDGQAPAIDVGAFRFELVARDVEELNKLVVGESPSLALRARPQPHQSESAENARAGGVRPYDVTAISCAAYPAIRDRYVISRCGGSFGEGYGPRVVVQGSRTVEHGREAPAAGLESLLGAKIAVPGVHTTAFLTLSLMLGSTREKPAFEAVEMLFSEIPAAVALGEVDAGLLIHEAQLTFSELGLVEAVNLGRWWSTQTDLPLPLGLNVVRRDLDTRHGAGTVQRLGKVLSASVRFAVEHPVECREHLQRHKGSRTEWDDPGLVDRYLAMYVSALTVDMGERGRRAIEHVLMRGHEAGLCGPPGTIDVV
ncbi:MAG: hypothetical protein KJZ65_05090 [Phycisphaerales bacterium]|nr:hypothetical protein [Phycisphaerales bacterium]